MKFGIVLTDDELKQLNQSIGLTSEKGSSWFKFGLNQKCFIADISYKDEGDGNEYLLLEVVRDEQRSMRRYYVPKRCFHMGKEITDTKDPLYAAVMKKNINDFSDTLNHIGSIFAAPEVVRAAIGSGVSTFKEYATKIVDLVKKGRTLSAEPVDVFLQYQFKIKGNAKQTYLELPADVRYGLFICKHVAGSFTEFNDGQFLYYTDGSGNDHPFKRTAYYLSLGLDKKKTLEEGGASSSGKGSDDKPLPF